MKHLLNGVAIAAALAIAAPVWAQAPAPSAPPKAPAAGAPMAPMAPMAGAPMAPMAGKQKHKRMRGAMAKGGKMGKMGKMGKGDSMTDQLNREELARIQGGGGPMAAPAPEGRMPMGGPRAGGGAAPPPAR